MASMLANRVHGGRDLGGPAVSRLNVFTNPRMRQMKLLKIMVATLSLGALLAAGGCGKNKAVAAAEKMATDVCACKDLNCAQEVVVKAAKDMEKFKDAKGSEADAKAIVEAGTKMQKCMEKLATGAMPK